MKSDFRCFISPNDIQKKLLCYSDGMGFESNPSFCIKRESFNNYLIMYTISGRLWCIQNGVKIAVDPGEYILMDLHLAHQYYFDEDTPSRIAWIHLNGEPVVQIIRQIQKLLPLPFKSADKEMCSRLIGCYRLSDCPDPDIFALSERNYTMLLEIFKKLYHQMKEENENPKRQEFRKNVWHVISHNLHRNISVDELAQSVCLSKYHFIRIFDESFGCPPLQFITGEKIRIAKYLLIYTADPVQKISESLGFDTPGYFTKVFRQRTGFTPSKYRKYGYLQDSPQDSIHVENAVLNRISD